jgi:murein DD-endopeptidase MepM/ murein hydrolase activator NlpD
MGYQGKQVIGKRGRLIVAVSAVALLSACDQTFDLDLRGEMGALDTSLAAGIAAAPRPEPDSRGVLSYPNFQVVVSQRGDTVSEVAARVGIGADALASYNGLKSSDILRSGEVLALPTRVAEPSAATGAFGNGPIRPISEIDITTLAGAAIDRTNASNVNSSGMSTAPQTGLEPIKHRVERGETAFTIARLYNVSIRALSDWNSLDADFTIREGQHLLVPVIPRAGANDRTDVFEDIVTNPGTGSITTPAPPSASEALPVNEPAAVQPTEITPISQPAPVEIAPEPTPQPASDDGGRLAYPVQGDILKPYEKGVNEGIDIAATAGTNVRSAEAGTVGAIVQDTNGVDIIVIKHAGNLLTVYTHVENPSVAKGDRVSRGQVIGTVRAGSPSFVHFEVRLGSDSVNPMEYLK